MRDAGSTASKVRRSRCAELLPSTEGSIWTIDTRNISLGSTQHLVLTGAARRGFRVLDGDHSKGGVLHTVRQLRNHTGDLDTITRAKPMKVAFQSVESAVVCAEALAFCAACDQYSLQMEAIILFPGFLGRACARAKLAFSFYGWSFLALRT